MIIINNKTTTTTTTTTNNIRIIFIKKQVHFTFTAKKLYSHCDLICPRCWAKTNETCFDWWA